MPNPSYYFTIFKKFQVLNHVPDGTLHGNATAPFGGFNLTDPNAAIGSSNRGALLGTTTNPADSPLWALLNARALGMSSVSVGGVNWPAMPQGTPASWTDFQITPPTNKLVQVFGDWIAAGKVRDVPSSVIATMPAPITAGLDPGVQLFVCSVTGDDGTRPGTVPSNFWATSLIFLADPSTGNTVNPPELSASSEYYLTAVIGNRGSGSAGQYNNPPGVAVEAAGWVMVFNTSTSPAVQLPALSNLDQTSTNGNYGVYFIKPGRYDVVGFRLNVQTVFDGLVKAVAASGIDLGGLTAEEWVRAESAHLCAKVLVRTATESWPTFSDTPFTNRRMAQKNLARFAVDLAVTSPDPNIIWRNFMAGDVFRFFASAWRIDERLGMHRLIIRSNLPAGVMRLFLAIPKQSFKRWLGQGSIKGFKQVDQGYLPGLKTPFPENVILQLTEGENWIELPPLGEEFLAMSLGIEYSVSQLEAGQTGEISIVQETTVPKIDPEKPCYEREQVIVGGFTLTMEVSDSRQGDPRYDQNAGGKTAQSSQDV